MRAAGLPCPGRACDAPCYKRSIGERPLASPEDRLRLVTAADRGGGAGSADLIGRLVAPVGTQGRAVTGDLFAWRALPDAWPTSASAEKSTFIQMRCGERNLAGSSYSRVQHDSYAVALVKDVGEIRLWAPANWQEVIRSGSCDQ